MKNYKNLKEKYNHLVDAYDWIFEYIPWHILNDDKISETEKLTKIRQFFEEYRNSKKREPLICLIGNMLEEYRLAEKTYPPFTSPHEGYAVILEEVEELKKHVFTNEKKRNIEKMKNEARQVTVVALRFMFDVCPHENDI